MPFNLETLLATNPELGQIFLYNVVGQLIQGMLAPFSQLLANGANGEFQEVPLTPNELARLVIRNYVPIDNAVSEAKQSGISPDDFRLLIKGTGNPIGPADAAEALRRGIIVEDSGSPDDTSFINAIRQGDIQDKWAPIIKALAREIPSPADILQALVEGQIDQMTGERLYAQVGGDPQYFELLYNTRGESPSPLEAATMAHRGVIPQHGTGEGVLSFEQAVKEGHSRNKWIDAWWALSEYLPPPRTVTAMVHQGALTDAQALVLWHKAGLSEELAAAYLTAAHSEKTAAHKHLTLSIIEQAYKAQALSNAEATTEIIALGYSPEDTKFILSTVDLQRQIASINHALTTVHSRYISGHIDRATALGAIDTLGISSAQRDNLLHEWDIERKARVAILTPAQVKKAIAANLLSVNEGLQRLENIGYSAQDANIILAI